MKVLFPKAQGNDPNILLNKMLTTKVDIIQQELLKKGEPNMQWLCAACPHGGAGQLPENVLKVSVPAVVLQDWGDTREDTSTLLPAWSCGISTVKDMKDF